MIQVVKSSYPTGKLFITFCTEAEGDNFDRFNWIIFRQDVAKLPAHQQSDYFVRRQVLSKLDAFDLDAESNKCDEFVDFHQANDCEVGYNLLCNANIESNQLSNWKVGIDGCCGGWFYIATRGKEITFGTVQTVSELLQRLVRIECIFIDIRIGLNYRGSQEHECDKLARQVIKPRGSTVFPAPIRPCLQASTYEEACQISYELSGKKLSKQAFHIIDKIKEIDELLEEKPELREKLREVHPELGFCMLNHGKPLLTKKKTAEGIEERLALLEQQITNAREIYKQCLANHRRKEVARDDIVDAMICLFIAQESISEIREIPSLTVRDSMGIRLAMSLIFPVNKDILKVFKGN